MAPYVWTKGDRITATRLNYALQKAGGTMTGPLILDADPVEDLEAATKKYVDEFFAAAGPEGRAAIGSWICFTIPGVEPVAVNTNTIEADHLYHEPIYVTTPITINKLVIEVTKDAVGEVRLGVYTADKDWQPVALVLDAGTVDVSSEGVKEKTVDLELGPGRYLLVLVSDVAPELRTIIGGSRYTGMSPYMTAAPFVNLLRRDFTFDALPETPSDWDTYSETALPFYHMVFVRVSEP